MDVDGYLTGVPGDLFRPHVILPAQHFNPPQKLTPEHRLMMGVLDDAVQCIQQYRSLTDIQGRRLFQEAQQWLLATEPHWPYSFERICAALDLDASAVRRRLLRLAPKRPPASGIADIAVGTTADIRSHTPPKRSSRTHIPALGRP